MMQFSSSSLQIVPKSFISRNFITFALCDRRVARPQGEGQEVFRRMLLISGGAI